MELELEPVPLASVPMVEGPEPEPGPGREREPVHEAEGRPQIPQLASMLWACHDRRVRARQELVAYQTPPPHRPPHRKTGTCSIPTHQQRVELICCSLRVLTTGGFQAGVRATLWRCLFSGCGQNPDTTVRRSTRGEMNARTALLHHKLSARTAHFSTVAKDKPNNHHFFS